MVRRGSGSVGFMGLGVSSLGVQVLGMKALELLQSRSKVGQTRNNAIFLVASVDKQLLVSLNRRTPCCAVVLQMLALVDDLLYPVLSCASNISIIGQETFQVNRKPFLAPKPYPNLHPQFDAKPETLTPDVRIQRKSPWQRR